MSLICYNYKNNNYSKIRLIHLVSKIWKGLLKEKDRQRLKEVKNICNFWSEIKKNRLDLNVEWEQIKLKKI